MDDAVGLGAPVAPNRFVLEDGRVQVTFATDAAGEVTGFAWTRRGEEGKAPRIGPLVHALAPRTDPDPQLTRKIEAAIQAFGTGATDAPELAVTAGLRRDPKGPFRQLAGVGSLAFVDVQDVAARGLVRHDGKVARVAYYRMMAEGKPKYLLIYLTADGLVTDFDVVDD